MNTAILSVRGAGRGGGRQAGPGLLADEPRSPEGACRGQEGGERQLPEYEVRRAREWKPPSAPSPASSDAGSAARAPASPGRAQAGTLAV